MICGGGPTGVEMAGAVRELFTKVISRDFPGDEVGRARVVLVEAADRLLGTLLHALVGPGPADAAPARGRGAPRHGRGEGRRTAVSTSPTAGCCRRGPSCGRPGCGPARWPALLDLPLGPGWPAARGRRTCRCRAVRRCSPSGDIAAAPDLDGTPLPQVAQPAIQGGRHAARQIRRRLQGLPGEPFRYHDKGSMATIGRNEAVTELPAGHPAVGMARLAVLVGPAPRASSWASATA